MAKFMALLSTLKMKSRTPKDTVEVIITNNLDKRVLAVNEYKASRYNESVYLDAKKQAAIMMRCRTLLFIWNMNSLITQLTLPEEPGGTVDITIDTSGSARVKFLDNAADS